MISESNGTQIIWQFTQKRYTQHFKFGGVFFYNIDNLMLGMVRS